MLHSGIVHAVMLQNPPLLRSQIIPAGSIVTGSATTYINRDKKKRTLVYSLAAFSAIGIGWYGYTLWKNHSPHTPPPTVPSHYYKTSASSAITPEEIASLPKDSILADYKEQITPPSPDQISTPVTSIKPPLEYKPRGLKNKDGRCFFIGPLQVIRKFLCNPQNYHKLLPTTYKSEEQRLLFDVLHQYDYEDKTASTQHDCEDSTTDAVTALLTRLKLKFTIAAPTSGGSAHDAIIVLIKTLLGVDQLPHLLSTASTTIAILPLTEDILNAFRCGKMDKIGQEVMGHIQQQRERTKTYIDSLVPKTEKFQELETKYNQYCLSLEMMTRGEARAGSATLSTAWHSESEYDDLLCERQKQIEKRIPLPCNERVVLSAIHAMIGNQEHHNRIQWPASLVVLTEFSGMRGSATIIPSVKFDTIGTERITLTSGGISFPLTMILPKDGDAIVYQLSAILAQHIDQNNSAHHVVALIQHNNEWILCDNETCTVPPRITSSSTSETIVAHFAQVGRIEYRRLYGYETCKEKFDYALLPTALVYEQPAPKAT